MKVILIAVVSLNGKLTNGDNPDIYSWTSKEDQDFFFSEIKKSKLIVMGSGTYEAVKGKFDLAEEERLRVVVTSTPDKYESDRVEGRLEFTDETPEELAKRFKDKYEEMLLTGGSKLHSSFIKVNLVDEVYLTIEPVIFGSGKSLFNEEEFEGNLELVSSEQLNKNGTLLLKYKVIR